LSQWSRIFLRCWSEAFQITAGEHFNLKCLQGPDLFNSRDRLFLAIVASVTAQLSEAVYRLHESGHIASKGMLTLSLDDRILENRKCGTRSTVKSHHTLGVLRLQERPAQPVEGDDGAASVVDAKHPLASNAHVKIGLPPKRPRFVQRFNRKMVARFVRGEGWSLTGPARITVGRGTRSLFGLRVCLRGIRRDIDEGVRIQGVYLHK